MLLGGRVLGGSAVVEGVEYLFSRNRKLRQRTMDISTWGEEVGWLTEAGPVLNKTLADPRRCVGDFENAEGVSFL